MLSDLSFLHQDVVGRMVPCEICGMSYYRRFDMDETEKICPDCRQMTRPQLEMPYLIDYSLGCSTSEGEISPGLELRTIEEIAREYQEESERIFRECFYEHGFSLEAGDWLFLPEDLGIYIPTSLIGQVMTSKYVQSPTFVRAPTRNKLEFAWEPRSIQEPSICWWYWGFNLW